MRIFICEASVVTRSTTSTILPSVNAGSGEAVSVWEAWDSEERSPVSRQNPWTPLFELRVAAVSIVEGCAVTERFRRLMRKGDDVEGDVGHGP